MEFKQELQGKAENLGPHVAAHEERFAVALKNLHEAQSPAQWRQGGNCCLACILEHRSGKLLCVNSTRAPRFSGKNICRKAVLILSSGSGSTF